MQAPGTVQARRAQQLLSGRAPPASHAGGHLWSPQPPGAGEPENTSLRLWNLRKVKKVKV